jgi:Tol biopolymer transport system component
MKYYEGNMKNLFIIAIPLIIIVILSGCIFEPYTFFKRWLCAVNIDGTDLQYLIEEDIGIVIPNLDGTKLIGYYNHEIYSMNPDGTDKETLVEYMENYRNPEIAMTPEGEMIVFDTLIDIYLLNLETNEIKNLSIEDTVACFDPSFSSNGQKICYCTVDFDSITTIHIMDYDGNNKELVYEYVKDDVLPLKNPYFVDTDDRIIYISYASDVNGLYSVDINGSNNHRIYEYIVKYSVSHNRLFIVFSLYDNVYRMNTDGSNLQLLASTYSYNVAPITSPNDSLILYPSTNFTIYVMNSDGSNKREVSSMEYDFDYYGYKNYNFRFINNERVILRLKK